MNKVLLDTNAYTNLLTGDERILSIIGGAQVVYMSIFVLGELYAGFAGGSKEQHNQEILRAFLLKPAVKTLNATSETAEIFGVVKNNLKKAGTPIPINDVWISAHTLETGSVLVTLDKHFHLVPGVRVSLIFSPESKCLQVHEY